MSYELVPDPIIEAYRDACKHDAATEWTHFMSYVTGFKSAMLMYGHEPLRHQVISQLMFLYTMAQQRVNMADHVFRRS